MFQRFKNKIPYFILAGLAAAAIFVWSEVLVQQPDHKLKIDFFDVGQGEAILIDAPNGNQVLIDGGPSDTILAKLGEALPFSDRKIELVILTHPDADHLSGLVEVLKRYDVGEILETGILGSSAEYQIWNELIKTKKIPVVFARAGQVVSLADGVAIKILYPVNKINGQDYSDKTNNTSIVGKIVYGKNSVLFTGDAEAAAENALLLSHENLKADILQVGHHGSKNSSGQEFLNAIAPVTAVIQVGANNKYGHPTPEVLDRLKGIKVFRTDQDGNVDFSCDLNECVRQED